MREILFRGKRTDCDAWVEGDLIQAFRGNQLSSCSIMPNTPTAYCWKVIPETVGQYTGLTDKNGVRIFEGDIVKCTDTINDFEFNAVVEFGNPNGEYNWGYQLKFISGEESNFDILCWVDMEETGAYIEIIGNIHDNPERLEGGGVNG